MVWPSRMTKWPTHSLKEENAYKIFEAIDCSNYSCGGGKHLTIHWISISWQFAGRLFLSIAFASVKYLIHLCRAVIHAANESQLKENIRSRRLASIFLIDTEFIPMEFFLLFDSEYKFTCFLLYLILNIFPVPWKMIKSKKKSWQAWRWPLGCTGGPLHRLVWGKPRALILQDFTRKIKTDMVHHFSWIIFCLPETIFFKL